MAMLFQLRERQVGSDQPALVKQFIKVSVEQHPPVPRRPVGGGALGADASRAVVCDHTTPRDPAAHWQHSRGRFAD